MTDCLSEDNAWMFSLSRAIRSSEWDEFYEG